MTCSTCKNTGRVWGKAVFIPRIADLLLVNSTAGIEYQGEKFAFQPRAVVACSDVATGNEDAKLIVVTV